MRSLKSTRKNWQNYRENLRLSYKLLVSPNRKIKTSTFTSNNVINYSILEWKNQYNKKQKITILTNTLNSKIKKRVNVRHTHSINSH